MDIRIGTALDTVPALADEEPEGLSLIKVDKGNNVGYLKWALTLD